MSIFGKYESIISKLNITAKENNLHIYIVGGFVRDLLLNRQANDLDIMVCGTTNNKYKDEFAGIMFAKILKQKYNLNNLNIFPKFKTSKLYMDNQEIEFIIPRKEYYRTNHRNPIRVKLASLKQDVLRRDFTINTLFLRIHDMKILDLTVQGIKDIRNRLISIIRPFNPQLVFKQDPLRMLRAIRQSLQLGFKIERQTYNAIALLSKLITIVPKNKIINEINKITEAKTPLPAFYMLKETKLLKYISKDLEIRKLLQNLYMKSYKSNKK
jgi:tRNA nucleotidyltransferase/poly(A) polymerase